MLIKPEKRRGIFLWIVILFHVLTVIVKLFSIYALLTGHINLEISPSGNPLIDLSETLILIVAIIGLLRWKWWGYYLVLIRLAITILVQLFVYQSLGQVLIAGYTGLENVIFDVVGAIIVTIAVYRQRADFE